MSNQFKGKKLVIINDYQKADYGTYPKMILRNTELTLLDKLILIVCHSYPTKDKNGNAMQWTLAYTRIAKEINCDQSHLICRWKHLINCNYIIDGTDTYTINYDAIINNFKVPPIIDNKRTKIGFHLSGATSVTPPAEVTPAGSLTPAAEPDSATRVTPVAADGVTPVEQQGFSDTATRVTPAEATRVTPANEYKENKQEENQKEKQDLKSNRDLAFKSEFFTGLTRDKVLELHNDFNNSNGRKKTEPDQFEKLLVFQFNAYCIKRNLKASKEKLIWYVDVVKNNKEPIFSVYDQLSNLLQDDTKHYTEFNQVVDQFKL